MARRAVRTAPIRRESLADIIYERLLEQILAGVHAAGGKLSELGLARQYQVSRGPVREALRRLAGDGLVHSVLNRKAEVVRLTARDLIDVYRVRDILESGAAESAARERDRRKIAAVRDVLDQFKRTAVGDFDTARTLELDSKFHAAVAEASGNAYLQREIRRYSRLVRVTQRLGVTRAGQRLAWRMHRRIYDAIERGDPDGARKAMSAHIASALGTLVDAMPDGAADGGSS